MNHTRSFITRITLLLFVLSLFFPAAPVHAQEEGPTLSDEQIDINNRATSALLDEIISTGGYHTCGVKKDGTLACWGGNGYGQTNPPPGTFTQVSAGDIHTCGVKRDGTVACWGRNNYGQTNAPTGIFTQASAGVSHTCGVKKDGTLACWGGNSKGQTNAPTGIFTQVSAGGYHTCGVKSDGTLACWGSNGSGQTNAPTDTFKQVSAGAHHTCGVKSNGMLACWGSNASGQTNAPIDTFIQVNAGVSHTCGVKSNGTAACWGQNDSGQSSPPADSFGPLPVVPTTYNPKGNTYSTKPTYSWSRISNATSYRLVIYSTSPSAIVVNKTISSSYCSTTTNRCSFTPTTALINTHSYNWKVFATNSWGNSSYSTLRSFKVLPGFNSTFNGSYSGWVKHPGGTWTTTSSVFYTNGAAAKFSSASYNASFYNFSYQARIKQPSANASSFSGLIVRGSPTFNTNNMWKNGLFFVYNKDGKYKVYKTVSGASITLKNWTSSSAIVKNGWNILKVTADGYHYKFYINGTLTWSGSDSSCASGRAGLISLSFSSSTAEKFYADWATLTMSDYYNK